MGPGGCGRRSDAAVGVVGRRAGRRQGQIAENSGTDLTKAKITTLTSFAARILHGNVEFRNVEQNATSFIGQFLHRCRAVSIFCAVEAADKSKQPNNVKYL